MTAMTGTTAPAPADAGHALIAPHALLPDGWAADVLLAWDAAGVLHTVAPGAGGSRSEKPDVPRAAGPLMPGMPNLHSHAFQRAFAGLSEYRGAAPGDSFWTWRDLMYRFALAVTPEQLEAIATRLYVEMLAAGYTSVCEFHYLHHDAAGQPYADPAEMALRLLAAARSAGIGITVLPVLYQHGGFGGAPPRAEQRRFVASVDQVLDIAARLRRVGARIGAAPHSLRAVAPAALAELIAGVAALDAGAPVHIHIAEQDQEVRDCLDACGQRPVQWLLDHAPVDRRWCLVHATHVDAAERRGIAASGAVVGLCPSTEADLGDGIFDAAAFDGAGGAWGIGSDSHVGVDPADELRLLEYTQRLTQRARNVLHGSERPQVAEHLWLTAVAGGAQAAGALASPAGRAGLAVGQPADFVVLDAAGANAGLTPAQSLATHVFAHAGRRAVRDVWVAGRQVIASGRHAAEENSGTAFAAARAELLREV